MKVESIIDLLNEQIAACMEENRNSSVPSTHAYNRGKVVAYSQAISLIKKLDK